MNSDCAKTLLPELIGKPVCSLFCCSKHYGLRFGILVTPNEVHQVLKFFALFYYQIRLVDGFKRDLFFIKPHMLNLVLPHVFVCQPRDLWWYRCREKTCLPVFVDIEQYELDVVNKAHVEHPVCFVEYYEPDI